MASLPTMRIDSNGKFAFSCEKAKGAIINEIAPQIVNRTVTVPL
jgi:hypothetical protein